jgi:uncharacterized protein YcfL
MGSNFKSVGWMVASVAAGAAVLSGAGCDTVRAPNSPRIDQLPTSQYPKVTIESRELADVLAVNPGSVTVTPGDSSRPMDVSVGLRSLADNSMNVQYRFQWFDESGRMVEEEQFKQFLIPPRTEQRLRSNPMTTKASDWRLQVRSARTVR